LEFFAIIFRALEWKTPIVFLVSGPENSKRIVVPRQGHFHAPQYISLLMTHTKLTGGMEMTLPPTANRAVVALDPAPRRDVARLGALAEAVRAVEVLGLCVRLDLSARAG
jgi:hypothetical protein